MKIKKNSVKENSNSALEKRQREIKTERNRSMKIEIWKIKTVI